MTEPLQHRPVTFARNGLVATPHYLASEAGLDIIKQGGNAIDAAIAANAMLQVVYPFVCGLGGDLFAIVWDPQTQSMHALNASGRAPSQSTPAKYSALGYDSMPQHGIHSVIIPGCPDGWNMLHQRFGSMSLNSILQPAITYAKDGFPVGPGLHKALKRMATLASTHRSWFDHFLPDGTIPAIGSIAHVPDFANTLNTLASEGLQSFYTGSIAAQTAQFFSDEHGFITAEDLAAHTSEWVTPLKTRFGMLDIYELPPNTQGITALQMLGIIDGLQLGDDPLDPRTIHLGIEAKRLAFADRKRYLTDPDYMTVDPAMLIADDYLAQRRALIDSEHVRQEIPHGSFPGDTIYLTTADRSGMIVSLIQSNYMGFGSGVVVAGTGIALQNRGAYFSLNPDHINVIAPGKRTLHTLIPSLALRDGKPAISFGTMGGDGQAQTHLQVYTALEKFGRNIQEAIEQPRWVHGAISSGGEEALHIESRLPESTLADLRRRGHIVEEVLPYDAQMGFAQGIVVDLQHGVYAGGSDPRAEGVAAGW